MGFWWFSFVCNLIIPVIMIVAGRVMWKHCPKEINCVLGYRTSRSMKNMDTWKFAHNYCGRIWFKVGVGLLIPGIIAQIPFYNSDKDTVGMVVLVIMHVQLVALFVSIIPTELALKKNFNDDGTRK